ncbi:MAG: hypothetical protein KDA52_24325, partial [Planctomycetaceae bacterium]|nr:hypothetical protein [Planctomycetaceae bacterium]
PHACPAARCKHGTRHSRPYVTKRVAVGDERPRSPGGGERLGFQKTRGSAGRVQRMVMPLLSSALSATDH